MTEVLGGNRSDASVLLAHCLSVDRTWLAAYPEQSVSSEAAKVALELAARRARGEPVAYLTGAKEFFSRRFEVGPAVLIPRPETEGLVDLALQEGPKEACRVLDLGCGSGCIGLTLALERPSWNVLLSDVSAGALQIAEKNRAHLLGPQANRVTLLASDWFSALGDRRFDIIVSNPPYIHPDEAADLDSDVRDFEPEGALFHPDPPALYRFLLEGALKVLESGGFVLFETSPLWIDRILAEAPAGLSVQAMLDFTGRQRYLRARRL